MTTVIALSMWATALSGWATALHLYIAGQKNMSPSSAFVIRSVIAGVISVMIGTLLLSAMNNISAFHGAFG